MSAPTSGTVVELCESLRGGDMTSVQLVEAYLERIEALNPDLRAVIAVNPRALADAADRDQQRQDAPGSVGRLVGIPILVKDNIETHDPIPTTAGSLALANNVTNRDAEAVAGLRAAGAVILGKANLSEWANFRSTRSSSGWSAVGGQARNPHDQSRTPCGSSSGSAIAVAAGMAPAAVGTETNGSIVCPASVNGVVGYKPSVGLIAQAGIVPISHTQDTAGPVTQTVADAALLARAMFTEPPPGEWLSGQSGEGRADLHGVRIGVLTEASEFHPEVTALFDRTLDHLRGLGADLVANLRLGGGTDFRVATTRVLLHEFKRDLNRYLRTLPPPYSNLTLAQLITYNHANAGQEMPHFRQELFEMAEATDGLTADYERALDLIRRTTREDGIDRLLGDHGLDALVSVTRGPAWMIDWVNGDPRGDPGGDSTFPAVAGYPHVSVPMGSVQGLPVGVSFVAGANDDAAVLAIADVYERHRPALGGDS